MDTIVSLLFVLVSVYTAISVIRAFKATSNSSYSSAAGIEGDLVEPGSLHFHASNRAKLVNQ